MIKEGKMVRHKDDLNLDYLRPTLVLKTRKRVEIGSNAVGRDKRNSKRKERKKK